MSFKYIEKKKITKMTSMEIVKFPKPINNYVKAKTIVSYYNFVRDN
jgi:hypothetical protein